MQPNRVYLCYQYREKDLAEALAAAVSITNGPLDQYDSRARIQAAGEGAAPQKRALEQAMGEADVVVGLIGPTTATSSWVGWELSTALALGKRVVLVRLSPEDDLPEGVSGADIIEGGQVEVVLSAIARS